MEVIFSCQNGDLKCDRWTLQPSDYFSTKIRQCEKLKKKLVFDYTGYSYGRFLMFSSQIALNLDHSKADLSIYLDILYCLPGPQTRATILRLLKFLTSEIELSKYTLSKINIT